MIRRKSLTARIRAVWSQDPALDREHEQFAELWKQYEDTADCAVLPVKQGEKLTVFDCNPLLREDWLRTQGMTSRQLADTIIAYSLQRLENYEGPDGRTIEIAADDFVKDGGSKHLKPDILAKMYDLSVFDDVADMVYRHSRLDPTRGQG